MIDGGPSMLRFLTVCVVLGGTLSGSSVFSAPRGSTIQTGGSTGDLERLMSRRLSISWQSVPLRDAVQRLATTQEVAIFLDRRIDSDQRLALAASDVTLRQALDQLAAASGCGTSLLSTLLYMGPPRAAAELRTLIARLERQVARSPNRMQQVWHHRRPLTIKRLADPRDVLRSLGERHQISIVGIDAVPHDAWAARELPPLRLSEQIPLLLIGFDLECQLKSGGRQVVIAPIERPVAVAKRYPRTAAVMNQVTSWQTTVSGVDVAVDRRDIVVRGRLEDHEELARILSSTPSNRQRPRRRSAKVQREEHAYTLRVSEQPLVRVLEQLGQQIRLEISYQGRPISESADELTQRVTFSVDNVKLDELLAAVLQPAGLVHQRSGQRVVVRRRP